MGPWTGGAAQFNVQALHLSTNKGFDIRHACIGIRGQGFPPGPKVNYFFLAEFSSNGITWPEGEADVCYVHFGYVVACNPELDIRYNTMSRESGNSVNERKFTTGTLGAQWFFNLKNRLIINYEIRSAEAPGKPLISTANHTLDGMDNRLPLQIISIF